MHILRTCQILQEVHQGFCKDGQAVNVINLPQGQVWLDSSTPYSIYDAEGTHYTRTYLMLPWPSREIHRIHRCIGQCVWSTTITTTWWNWIPNSILISHLYWNTKEVEYPRTGSLWSILCYYQMELLPPRIHSDHKPLTRFLNGKNANNKVKRWWLEFATYNITFEWISGERNKVADCPSRLVKLLNDSKATVTMLTATNSDGPAFNTRSKTSQQCQTTKDTRLSNTPTIIQPATSDLTTVETTQDITLKLLTADRHEVLLQM